jgi:hypothetical protein
MTQTAQLLEFSGVGASAPPGATVTWARQVRDKTHRLGTRIASALNACAVCFGQAALYEELFKLSDAELRRHGLSRGDLHRWVAES